MPTLRRRAPRDFVGANLRLVGRNNVRTLPHAPTQLQGPLETTNSEGNRRERSKGEGFKTEMENGGTTQGEGKDPSGFLGEIINSAVTVKLNSGVVYKGTAILSFYYTLSLFYPLLSLASRCMPGRMKLIQTPWTGELQSVDGYMNIALEKCSEHVNGVKKRSYGDAFIRGNNGMSITEPAWLWRRIKGCAEC